MSLDGFIADVDGGYEWITGGEEIDFVAFMSKIDALLMGRGTYETALSNPGGLDSFAGMALYVVSTTLDPEEVPGITLISDDVENAVRALKAEPGKDIWLFGGGVLFRSLLAAGLVDRVEVGVVPVLLGEGIPVLPGFSGTAPLELHSSETFDDGMVLLKYDVVTA